MNSAKAAPRIRTPHAPFNSRMSHLLHAIASFASHNAVLCVAVIAAVTTSVFVPPDAKYLSYFDFKTLSCLLATLAVVCALRGIGFFTAIARAVVARFSTLRSMVLALVYVTFIGSMFIANDMALLTFLPLGYYILSMTGKEKYMAYVFILQNIAANLGGMLTPFGNPQNLYLYTKFSIPNLEFTGIMLPSFLLSVTMITVCCLFFGRDRLTVEKSQDRLPAARTVIYLILFALAVTMVFRVIPYYIGLAVIMVSVFILDRKALLKVDYPLLLTFSAFFVFAGNMGRIDAVRSFFTSIPDSLTLISSTLSCQLISNVPSAVLLSQFTGNYRDLLIGVNIGGTGTLIASLASLITFREYMKRNPGKAWKYIGLFSAFNFAFLAVLLIFNVII